MSTTVKADTPLVKLTIDGTEISVPKGTTVYQAATKLGSDVPIFCYHDRMPPFGACRVCLVEVEKMPKLQASCTLEVAEGMIVKTQSERALEGRKGIVELLLINHPLDCPICDRGGECPLQEHALHHGPGESRFFEDKRRFKKPFPLGPVLMLDRERCIVCARCTRFGDLIAGDHALEFIDRGYRTEVGTPNGAPAESKFIGNTIQICPVGALTSQVYRFRARPWDNDSVQSACTLCPVGCSLFLDSRDGEIMRTRSCPNSDVNDIWLCDKGWFGYEYTSHPERQTSPMIRKNGKLSPVDWDEAITFVAKKIIQAKPRGKLAAIGGNHITTEENYLLQSLMRNSVGVNHVDHRIGMPIFGAEDEGLPPGMESAISDCEKVSFAILLGLDLTEEFPVIWLRLRQAINNGAKVIFAGHYAPEIAPHLNQTILHPPGEEIKTLQELLPMVSKFAEGGKAGMVLAGRQYLASPLRKTVLHELVKWKQSLPDLKFNLMEGKGNSMGARIAGMHPEFGPLGQKISKPGMNILQIFDSAAKNGWDFLYVVSGNPATKYPAKLWSEVRKNLGLLVVQDLFLTETAEQADVFFPTLSAEEKSGSIHNIEGRLQWLQPGKMIPGLLRREGEIFKELAEKLNHPLTVDNNFSDALTQTRYQLPRYMNQLQSSSAKIQEGKLLATFAPALFDNGVRMNHNDHLHRMVKEPKVRIQPAEGNKRGIGDGKTVRLMRNGNSINAKVKYDPSVAPGTVVIPIGFKKLAAQELGYQGLNGIEIEIAQEA